MYLLKRIEIIFNNHDPKGSFGFLNRIVFDIFYSIIYTLFMCDQFSFLHICAKNNLKFFGVDFK